MFCPYCGKELNNNAAVCLGCGRSVPKNGKNDSSSAGWWWLGFLLPMAGFILWIVWMNDCPNKSKKCGWGALIGVIASVVLAVIFYVLYFVLMFYLLGNSVSL